MYITENPASRLYDILKKVHVESKGNPTTKKYYSSWSIVLGLESDDLDGILKGIIKVQELYNQTRSIVEDSDILNKEKNTKQLDKIFKALYGVTLQGNMSQFHTYIKPDTLSSLSYISDLIEATIELEKNLLTENEKEELITNIDKTIDNLVKGDLPVDLKTVCTDNLVNIKNSLLHYEIHGANGLQDSIKKATGEAMLEPNMAEHTKDESIEKYFGLITKINTLLTTSGKVVKLAQLINLLP